MYSCFGNIRFLTERQADHNYKEVEMAGDEKRGRDNEMRLVDLDEVTYPGTLGRFLTVQVLCHLGQEEKSH